MSEYITIDCSGTFLKNAGIVGLIRFLVHNNARENTDYIIEGYELRVSVDYLRYNDIAQMYFDTVTDIFEKHTPYYRLIVEERAKIESYMKRGLENLEDSEIENLKKYFKSFENFFLEDNKSLKSSIQRTIEILSNDGICCIDEKKIIEMRTTSDLNLKYSIYTFYIDIICKEEVKKHFVYTCLLYGDLQLFFNSDDFGTIIPLNKKGKNRHILIHDNFYRNLIDEIYISEKKKNNRCIECMEKSSIKIKNSFMVDTADDVGKKRSHYWNLKADAFICPNCAFLYLFVPLGFAFLGRTAVFINMNSSVEMLYKIMDTYRSKTEDENATYYQKLYKIFTDEKIQILSERLSNIQIVFRDTNSEHYNMKIIDKPIIKKLQKANKSGNLSSLERISLVHETGKDNKKEYIYESVFDCILSYKSLYGLIDKCIRYEFSKDSTRYWYIFKILKTEIIFNGGNEVDNLMKEVNWAFETGKQMRKAILGENAFSDKNEDDNAIRSFVYRLINLSSVGDTAQFMDTVLRQYSGYGLTIPAVFKNCYKSEEDFKAIAHGYILGLKYCKSNGENNNNNEGDNKNE